MSLAVVVAHGWFWFVDGCVFCDVRCCCSAVVAVIAVSVRCCLLLYVVAMCVAVHWLLLRLWLVAV